MSTIRNATTARAIVDEVLGRGMTREIWTANYDKALPITVQQFDLTAVLPAVFYMFRFGYRRGQGRFLDTFGGNGGTNRDRRRHATIHRVARELGNAKWFGNFSEDTEQAILGDMLLCFCLENTKKAWGRLEQVQRVAPAHYMSSWVDLPERMAHLRFVPEMIVAMLADQSGQNVQQTAEGDRTWFSVGQRFEENVLLKAFHQGVVQAGPLGGRTSDRFDEEIPIGLDQLLMVRLAGHLGEAPDRIRGNEDAQISNQRPIAEQAARQFSEDMRQFVRAYAEVIPRHAFVELLESCMAIGLTTIVTSVIRLLLEWSESGEIRKKHEQQPIYLFVDCSNGVDRRLRGLAEQSMDDVMRRIERFPVVLMALRLLDHGARYDRNLKQLDVKTEPYATEWLNLLGELLYERREEASPIFYNLESKAAELAERLQADYSEATNVLRGDLAQPNPVWRIAEALTLLQGRGNTQAQVIKLVDSVLLVDRPNGLATKRGVRRREGAGSQAKSRDVRSLVFTDAVLDYLVHVHVLRKDSRGGLRQLSLKNFIKIIHDRHGLCIDEAPEGMTISNDLLERNRVVLERRLRDLGLLVGVNDAEAMKRLTPRFRYDEENDNEFD